MIKVRKIVLAGLFLAVSVILPITFGHLSGIPGTVFLPMHFGVLLCGFFVGGPFGMLCGMLAPLLSRLFTPMPSLFPMLPIMFFELAVYGLVSGLMYSKTKKIYVSLITAMIAGRIMYAVVFYFMLLVLNLKVPATVGVIPAVITGWPGMAAQLILVPLVVQVSKS